MLEFSLYLKATRVNNDPIAMEAFCDWLEASVLFSDDKYISFPEVVEFLVDEELCHSQTQGWDVVSNAKLQLRKRARLLGEGYPVKVSEHRLSKLSSWTFSPSYAFCLLLSLRPLYPDWFLQFGSDYTEQGELFENLTHHSLQRILAGWQVHQTGWSRTNPMRIEAVVKQIADLLDVPTGDSRRWMKPTAKDGGLDILCFRQFVDKRGGVPIYLVQCASGIGWEHKLTTPNLDVWCNLVQFSARPQRAFATPLSFVDEDFDMHACRVQGLLIDRYRLLEPLRSKRTWLPRELSIKLNRWTRTRVLKLPWAI